MVQKGIQIILETKQQQQNNKVKLLPRPTNVNPSFVFFDTIRISHAIAKQKPAPMAGPLMAAMTGSGM